MATINVGSGQYSMNKSAIKATSFKTFPSAMRCLACHKSTILQPSSDKKDN
jgi:hypothetical protein